MGYSMPFFPMYAAETLADGRFQAWSCEERGAWLTLICLCWNDGDIPESQTVLGRLLHLDAVAMASAWSAIGDRFCPVPGKPGRLMSPRLEEERDKAETLSRKRAEAGLAGASARWDEGKQQNGKRIRLPKQTHSKANATAMRSVCPPPPPSPPSPDPTISHARSPQITSAGGSKLGPLGAELVAYVESGLGHGLIPAKNGQASELEALVAAVGVPDAQQFIAATCRQRATEPQSVAWLVTVLRSAVPPASEATP